MVHDPDLLDKLDRLPKETFRGEAFRATRKRLDPLLSSRNGGRWMPTGGTSVLYTSLSREGALAEISYHWSQWTPRPSKPAMLHTLCVVADRTLKLLRTDLTALGVGKSEYLTINLPRTQEIGAAVEFLGCDGFIAPSARWSCENLILFPDRMGLDAVLDVILSEDVDWLEWATRNNIGT